jgi:hypothetical protein
MKLFFKLPLFIIAIGLFVTSAVVVEAQVRAYRVTDRQVRTLLNRIETKTDSFRRQIDAALDRSRYNNSGSEDMINNYIADFDTSTDTLSNNFNSRTSASNDVYSVLQKAATIDNFMRNNRLNASVQNQWKSLRTDLNTLANYYNVAWNWNSIPTNNPTSPNYPNSPLAYTVADNLIRSVITNLENNTDRFKRNLDLALDRSSLNNTRSEDTINGYVADFESATNTLKSNFDSRRSTDADVESVLSKGYIIDGFMRDYRLTSQAETQWRTIRQNLDTLAKYYSVSANWNPRSPVGGGQFDTGLDGTYRLNTSLSDDVNVIVQSVGNRYFTGNQRDRLQTNLQRRLASPEYLAIDKNGTSVTIGSNLSPQVTIQADGRAVTETMGNRRITVTGTTNYNSVSISYEGDRINDFFVSFTPLTDGRLRVVRRVNLENRNETVTVSSVYDKVNRTPDFAWVADRNPGRNNQGNIDNAAFFVPNGVRLSGTLNEMISTATSNDGARFTITVNSPSQYSGATIYGYVSQPERSGRVSGRASMTLNFEQIRLRNGSTYQFRGIVEQVTNANGSTVSVNNEGVVRDRNQTNRTIVRSGIGAALGAIIGAVISGGDGAAVGAAIGGGAGAGSVIAQGRDDLTLQIGSQIVISSSAPNTVSLR